MKRVTALMPAEALPGFSEHLHRLSVLHLSSIDEELPEHFQASAADDPQARENCARLEQVVSFCESWGAGKRSFLESVFPAKTCASEAHIREAAARTDIGELHRKAEALRAEHERLLQQQAGLEKEADRLRLFAALELPPARLAALKHMSLLLVRASKTLAEEMSRSCPSTVAWEPFAGELHYSIR